MPSTRISARVSAISESATLAVDAKAEALKAAGRPVIGFGAGEPDFPTPGYIVEAAQRAAAEPRFHKYTPAGGLPELKQAIAGKTLRDSRYKVTADQVLVFVSPSNPTGAVYPPEQVKAIGEWANEHGIWVVTDEIYEHLVYGDAEFSSIPVQTPEIADRTVVLNGVAKTYAMTGWRVGWMVGPKDVISAAANLQSHATSNVCNVAQAAALTAVSGDLSAVADMRAAFDRRRQAMARMLNEIPGVICPEPQGAFYCYPSVKGLLGREIAGQRPQTSAELAGLILDEAEVAVVPGEAFGTAGYFRLSCALGDADLEEGIGRMAKLLAEAR